MLHALRQRALELMMTGRNVSSEEAVAIGLALSRTEGDVLEEALKLARRIARNGPVAVRLVKRAARLVNLDAGTEVQVRHRSAPAAHARLP